VDIAFHRRHQDLAGGLALAFDPVGDFLGLHVGGELGHGLFHHACGLHDLRQEHLARAEEVADDVHAGHQRALDDVERTGCLEPGLFDVVFDELGHAIDECV
jgi:hypothetical protein